MARRRIVESEMKKYQIDPKDYAVRKVAPADVSSYLSAADAGIAFYRPGISRLGTSPVKVSEYLACGLPVVIERGHRGQRSARRRKKNRRGGGAV